MATLESLKSNGRSCHDDFRDKSEVHQCWDCDSEGEFYETVDDNLIDDSDTNSVALK